MKNFNSIRRQSARSTKNPLRSPHEPEAQRTPGQSEIVPSQEELNAAEAVCDPYHTNKGGDWSSLQVEIIAKHTRHNDRESKKK